jgi:hypothetical protein
MQRVGVRQGRYAEDAERLEVLRLTHYERSASFISTGSPSFSTRRLGSGRARRCPPTCAVHVFAPGKPNRVQKKPNWPAPGSEDTELGVLMGPEVCDGEAQVHAGVQA